MFGVFKSGKVGFYPKTKNPTYTSYQKDRLQTDSRAQSHHEIHASNAARPRVRGKHMARVVRTSNIAVTDVRRHCVSCIVGISRVTRVSYTLNALDILDAYVCTKRKRTSYALGVCLQNYSAVMSATNTSFARCTSNCTPFLKLSVAIEKKLGLLRILTSDFSRAVGGTKRDPSPRDRLLVVAGLDAFPPKGAARVAVAAAEGEVAADSVLEGTAVVYVRLLEGAAGFVEVANIPIRAIYLQHCRVQENPTCDFLCV